MLGGHQSRSTVETAGSKNEGKKQGKGEVKAKHFIKEINNEKY
jgi:hypothetical protein